MKLAVGVRLISFSVPALADSYTSVVSDVKHFKGGGAPVDLDGHWPHEKMALYVPPAEGQQGHCDRHDRRVQGQAGNQNPLGIPIEVVGP